MMNSMSSNFCKICKEAHINKFHQIVNIIDTHTPQFGQLPITDSINFYVKPVAPSTHNLNIQWLMNGVSKSSAPIFSIQSGEIPLGNHKIKVSVSDPQPDVKYPVKESSREIEWRFTVIDPVNQLAPVGQVDYYTVEKNKQLNVTGIGVTLNDYDPNGDIFTASLISTTTHGTLSLQPKGNFIYTPNKDFKGLDSFTYKINDGETDSLPVKTTIKVIEKDIYKDNLNTASMGFFTTLDSPLGTFTAPANTFELKELNQVKYIKIPPNAKQASLTLDLTAQLAKVPLSHLHFNLEQTAPGSNNVVSVVTVEGKVNGQWEVIFDAENTYPQSNFTALLANTSFEAFRFSISSDQIFKLYSITLEASNLELKPPITTDAHIVNFDLGNLGTRIGGGTLAQRVITQTAATAPKLKAKPGYKFTGWSATFTQITSDQTIHALYEKSINKDELKLDLKKGWNFISIPLKNANLKPLLNSITGKCWKWSENNVYEPITDVKSQEGLWVRVNKDKTVTIKGEPTFSQTISLQLGWNAYGPFKDGTIPEGIEAIFSWESGKYKQLDTETDKLERGKAYWIFSTNQEDIELRIEP